MRILTRYIIAELSGPFFTGLGFFTFIFILSPILRLVDLLVVKRVPLGEVLLLFFYLLPSTVAIALPMAVLVAVLMAYGGLSSGSEIVAARASGIHYARIFLPAVVFSVVISVTGILFNDTLLPRGNYAFQKLYMEIIQRKPLTEIQEHTLTPIGDRRIIGIDRIDKRRNVMNGIVVYEKDLKTGGIRTITAGKGSWLPGRQVRLSDSKTRVIMRLLLENGSIQEPSSKNIEDFSNVPFEKLIVNITEDITYSAVVFKGAREKTASEIKKDIAEQEKNTGKRAHSLRVEYHKRFSIPFAALAFVLLGLPFSIVSHRSGKSVSLGVSIIIIFIYYLFYILGEGMGKQGRFNELLALWIPNFLFFAGGGYYITRISRT